ncbi:hypothetical protein PSHT_04199 [Puccinia striiformis]|uniref:RING-CH-type domain-containing protein n=1 Tax=Puccinia striiformis TaxID=27350 RepID=A0A2S4WDK5_9BASI|nr:hypothetical protein PSHT_04199 [Puccinia striiformis]
MLNHNNQLRQRNTTTIDPHNPSQTSETHEVTTETSISNESSDREPHQELSTGQETTPNEPETELNHQEKDQEQTEEEPLCRICLSGRDDEDPSLGRFIQPCLCRGTMANIHVGCLQRWRITSPSPKSFYRCDQCGYRYKLRRAKIAGLAENSVILGAVTFTVFFILVIVSGFISNWLLESYSQIAPIESHWDSGLGPFSYDSTGKIVGEVVGEAVRVLNSKLHVDGTRSTKKMGSTPVRKSKLVKESQSENEVSKLKPIQTDENGDHTYRYVRGKEAKKSEQEPVNTAYSNRASPRTHPASTPTTTSAKSENEELENEEEQESGNILQTILNKIFNKLELLIKHVIKGLAFIGVMSFFQLAMSVTLFSPWNFGIRNSVLRMMRSSSNTRTTSNGRVSGTDPNGIGSLLLLIFVLLGVLKAIQSVWNLVRNSSQWALRKIEDGVLDRFFTLRILILQKHLT